MIEASQEPTAGTQPWTQGREERRQLVERVLASELFRRSPKLSAFLRFICEQQETGNARAIHEQMIGVQVFERRPGYSVGDDSIVRSQARFLRQRLEEYFAREGRNESLVIMVPKGSYVPVFETRHLSAGTAEAAASAPSSRATPRVPSAARDDTPWGRWYVGLAILLALAAGIALWRWAPWRSNAHNGQQTNLKSAFWGSIFEPDQPTVIVPSDSSLVVMEQLQGGPVHVHAYSTREYLKNEGSINPGLWNFISESQYTNVADLNFVSHLMQLPEVAKSRPQISYSRDVSLKELKDGNAVLIGGAMANPWVELFASSVDFDVDFDWSTHHGVVSNRAPAANEKSRYVEIDSGKEGEYQAFGVIAYVPSLGTHGHSLLIEGTSKAGTEAAAEFLSSDAFGQFLNRIAKGGATVPNFELLLSTRSLRGASHDSAIVCWHEIKQN